MTGESKHRELQGKTLTVSFLAYIKSRSEAPPPKQLRSRFIPMINVLYMKLFLLILDCTVYLLSRNQAAANSPSLSSGAGPGEGVHV